jgi:predicted aspartyl protease
MIIQRKLKFKGSQGQAELDTLFDSGATMSCIHPDKAKLVEKLSLLPEPFNVGTASAGTYLEIKEYATLVFYLNDHRLIDVFLVVPNLNAEVVIGVDTLQKYHTKLDFETGEIILDPNAGKLMLM